MPRRQNRIRRLITYDRQPRTTLWDMVKYFFENHLSLSEETTRQYLLDYLYFNGFESQVRKARSGASTIDTYRNYLEKAGYMEKIRRGRYKTIRHIPAELSIADVKQEAYGIRIDRERLIAFDTNSLRKAIRSLEIQGFSKRDVWDTRKEYKQKQEDFLLESDFKV